MVGIPAPAIVGRSDSVALPALVEVPDEKIASLVEEETSLVVVEEDVVVPPVLVLLTVLRMGSAEVVVVMVASFSMPRGHGVVLDVCSALLIRPGSGWT